MITRALMLCLLALSAVGAPRAKTVTLDVQDVPIREVLTDMQKQCGIRNLVIDREVSGNAGMLKFDRVPCRTAFRTVLRMHGLTGTFYENSVVRVGATRE